MYPIAKSTIEQREKFYKKEFSVSNVKGWFGKKLPQFFVLNPGLSTGIKKNINKNSLLVLKPNTGLKELREKCIEHLPENVYFDRNIYKDSEKCMKECFSFKECFSCDNLLGQELVFDLNPKKIGCAFCKDQKEHLKFCPFCLKEILKQAIKLKRLLEKEEKFKKVKIVYSGRGCHIHIKDENIFKMNVWDREKLNKKYQKFSFDPLVSSGEKRLIKLPYSLNSIISRIVTPIKEKEIKNFDIFNNSKIVPKFFKK